MNWPFRKASDHHGEVICECMITETTMLCADHLKPLWFKKEDVEKAKAEKRNRCDFCRMVDWLWLHGAQNSLEDWQRRADEMSKGPDPWTRLMLPKFPDIRNDVALAIEVTVYDFKRYPQMYRSICEKKLELVQEAPPEPGELGRLLERIHP